MFSVIIPTKNSRYSSLSRAIESVSNDLVDEIIVVYDGTVDSTQVEKLRSSLAKAKLKVLTTGTKCYGPGKARQVGLGEAKGKYILFLDSDDEFEKGALYKLKNHIESKNQPDIVVLDLLMKSGDTKSHRLDLPLFETVSKTNLIRDIFQLRTRAEVMLNCINTRFLKQTNISFREGIHEDIDYNFLLFSNVVSWTVARDVVYIKHLTEGSITSDFRKDHVEGLFGAYENMLSHVSPFKDKKHEIAFGVVNMIGSLISKIVHNGNEASWKKFKEYLSRKNGLFEHFESLISHYEPASPPTKFQKLFNIFYIQKDCTFEQIKDMARIPLVSNLGCKDLKDNLFLRPNEFRTCCRRFFVDNQLKGDVTILSENDEKTIENFYRKKNELAWKIATAAESECSGCPFISESEHFNQSIQSTEYISMEEHTVCNMKCTYCDDTYYGGLQPDYDVNKILNELLSKQNNSNNELKTIVWGGGEPTIGKQFDENINLLLTSAPNAKHRIVTNSVKYSTALETLLNRDMIQFTTSVDAGTSETFSKIRGYNHRGLDRVLSNIAKYSAAAASPLTIKYLFSDENSSKDEIIDYVKKIEEYKLQKNIFQISINFKFSKIPDTILESILLLFGKLYESNCRFIFLDEIILQRLQNVNDTNLKNMVSNISNHCDVNFIANAHNLGEVSIYGASYNTSHLLTKSHFFKKAKVKNIFDTDPKKHGLNIGENIVVPYRPEQNTSENIYISAVQGFSSIYDHLISKGHKDNLIVRKLII